MDYQEVYSEFLEKFFGDTYEIEIILPKLQQLRVIDESEKVHVLKNKNPDVRKLVCRFLELPDEHSIALI
jgi:hypothetical protein